MHYQNFDLEIISTQGGAGLAARVLDSPQGDCPFVDVKWPFEPKQESELLGEIYGGLRQRGARGCKPNTIQDFGGKLFDAIFTGDIEHLFRSSLDIASRNGKGLRIVLRLPENSDLHARPWEYLFDTECREFLAVREHTPLVRYLPVAQPIPPITVEGPLRVLVALSAPTDHPRLDIAREWDILWYALEPSINAGHIELRRVPGRCTFDNLRDSLRNYGADIFHFVGHGVPGALVLEQESGKGLELEATQVRAVFRIGALPRLIVLNACSGAQAEDAPLSGLAQGFLRQGVPAVVAMQASITDDAALIFTRYFYRDLVETGAVDASLTEARLRMQGGGNSVEWGTPVLYMRALSGQLFQPRGQQGGHAPTPMTDSAPLPQPRPQPQQQPQPRPQARPQPRPQAVQEDTARSMQRADPPASPPSPSPSSAPSGPGPGSRSRQKRPPGDGGARARVEPRLPPQPQPPPQPQTPPQPQPQADVAPPADADQSMGPPVPAPDGGERTDPWEIRPGDRAYGPPAPAPEPAPAPWRQRVPAQWLTFGLVAVVLMLAFGAYQLFSGRGRTPVADTTAPTATTLPAPSSVPTSPPATAARTTPATEAASSAADLPRTAPKADIPSTARHEPHRKPPTAKANTVQKRSPPSVANPAPASDKCRNEDVSSRSVECLFP